MDAITLDQITVLLAVEEQGSFSGAARRLGRAQSAVTYAIQKLEDRLGTALFDRSGYRPVLTEAGRALLPRAQRIAEEMGAFRAQARGMAAGLESELALVADAMFPMPVLLAALRAFGARYPTVPVRVYVETLEAPPAWSWKGAAHSACWSISAANRRCCIGCHCWRRNSCRWRRQAMRWRPMAGW